MSRLSLDTAGRVAGLAVAGVLIAATMVMVWFATMFAASMFTSSHGDGGMFVFVLILVCMAPLTGLTALAIVGRFVSVQGQDAGCMAFLAIVFVLPIAASLATGVYEARRWPLYVYPHVEYSVRRPPDWTVTPGTSVGQPRETVTLASGSMVSSRAGVPAHALQVTIRRFDGPPPAGERFAVGERRYPGTIAAPAQDATTGTYTVAIVYEAGGGVWEVSGAFAEPPDRANPATDIFYDIVASIRHGR